MNNFSTFLCQCAVFLNGGLAIHTLFLLFPDNQYEPTLWKFVMFCILGIMASGFSFWNNNR